MADELRDDGGKPVYSVEQLRKLPQKLYLGEREYPAWLPAGIALAVIACSVAWSATALRYGWGGGTAIVGSLAALLAGYAGWLVMRWFIIPVLRAKGFSPMVEYIPEENKVVVLDRPGRSVWGEENAVMTIFLESLSGVVVERDGEYWFAAIRLKKGDPLVIRSSARRERPAACRLASELAAMLAVPFSDADARG